MSKHTPGPWRWEINMQSKILHLVGGRPQFDLTVIDFDRWGMGRATMSLRDTSVDGMNLMHKLHERPDWIAPFPGREHHASWLQGLTHPDARLIAAAPDLLEALNDLLEAADSMRGTYGCIQGRHPEEDDTHIHDKWAEAFLDERATLARAAIAKATGEQS